MSNNQENPRGDNPEIPPKRLDDIYPERLDETYEIYSDPHTSGETDEAVQQSPETPNSRYQRVSTYLGSLMERVGLGGDSEERRQEYDQAAEDMNRLTDIENRVRWEGQEMTAQDVYFLRQYKGKAPRISALLQDRDPETDLNMMLQEFNQTQLVRGMVESGYIRQNILVDDLDKFLQSEAIDPAQLARYLMDEGIGDVVVRNLYKFQEVPDDVWERLPR
ncbi:hypothetical protein BRC19_02420 [Candidatus Saccharibacteria bacterium QS_5_54_17]|nr:MAG: hypothetical protein BRC19_02420 [Candidatus Saccharibacteria bacterium QS_5_54_17]